MTVMSQYRPSRAPRYVNIRWVIQTLNFSTGAPKWVECEDITEYTEDATAELVSGMKRNSPEARFRMVRVIEEVY